MYIPPADFRPCPFHAVLEACAAQNKAGDLLPQYAVRPSWIGATLRLAGTVILKIPDLTSPALSEHISMPSYDLTNPCSSPVDVAA